MTINDENKVIAAIGHPRLMGGQFIRMNIINMSDTIENNIRFIEYPREPDEVGYSQGPVSLGVDMLRVQNEFEPTVRLKTQGSGATPAVPDEMVIDDNEAEVSGDDREDIIFEHAGYDEFVHFGATKIKEDSEVVRNDSTGTLLEKGEDYQLDPDRGMIKIFESAGSLDESYSIGYTFKNTARNIAYMISKIPKLGGNSVFVYDIDDFTGGEGRTYTSFVDTVRHELDPRRPDEAEVTIEVREAHLIDFDEGGQI